MPREGPTLPAAAREPASIPIPRRIRAPRALWLVAAALLFVWGAERQGRVVNTYMHASDQFDYMTYAKNMARTDFQVLGPRSRMPIYPALMASLYREGTSDDEFFALGKRVGIVIALAVLAVVYVVFRLHSTAVDALTATLVAAFTVLVYKAPYFQCEVLFYGVTLVLFASILAFLRSPRASTAVWIGLVGGFGHLVKASVLPTIVLGVASLAVRAILEARGSGSDASDTPPRRPAWPTLIQHGTWGVVLLACFLIVVGPYLLNSKRHFGSYFYNVTSTFYMWYDSFEEAKRGTRAHGDERGWPDLPESEIPSARRYWLEHGLADIGARLGGGLYLVVVTTFRSYGYAWFLLLYVVSAALFLSAGRRRSPRAPLRPGSAAQRVFVVSYFASYLLLYAWYAPIASGNRFSLALFLPAILLALRALSVARDRGWSIDLLGRRIGASEVSPALLRLLIVYLVAVLPFQISTVYGGT